MAAVKNFGPLTPPPRCFQGVVPAGIATCDRDGVPNVTYLSQVYYVDDDARRAVVPVLQQDPAERRREPATRTVQLYDPLTFEAYRLGCASCAPRPRGRCSTRWRCASRRSPRTPAWPACSGCCSADVYEVLSCETLDGFLDAAEPVLDAAAPRRCRGPLHRAARPAARLASAIARAAISRAARRRRSTALDEVLRLHALDDAAARRDRQAAGHDREPRLRRRAASAPRSRSAKG